MTEKSSAILRTIRIDAAHLAASFFMDDPPDLARLWTLTRFFEQHLLHGTDGTRDEFGPKEVRQLRAVGNG